MLFKILFLISIVGLIFFSYLNSKKDSTKLLQSIAKTCNIDSVRFEKRFMSFVFFLKNKGLRLLYKVKNIFKKTTNYTNTIVHTVKRQVRKKLFVEKQKEEISEFISEMKK